MSRIIVLLLLFCSAARLQAQQVLSLSSKNSGYIGTYTSTLTDKTNNLTIQDVIKKKNEFIPCPSDVFYSNPGPEAHWTRFTVKNSVSQSYYLVVDNPALKELIVYSADSVVHKIFEANESTTFDERPVKTNNYVIPLRLDLTKETTFYIKYRSISSTYLPLKIVTPEVVIEDGYDKILFYGFFYGILVFAFLYNFFIYFVTYDKSYLYYIATVFFILIYQSWTFGHFFQFIISDSPKLNQELFLYNASIIGVCHIAFVREFLGSKTRVPKWHRLGQILQLLFLLTSVIAPFDSYMAANNAAFAAILSATYSIVLGVIVYLRGYKPARFYIIAHGVNFICMNIFIVKSLGYLPHTFLTQNLLVVGIGMEMLLLSFALGDSYKRLRQEREEMQEKLNKELNLKILERTQSQQEMEQVNKNLLQINADLDNFIYAASHNLKGPVATIEGLINILDLGLVKPDELKSFFGMIRTSLNKLKGTVIDLTEISRVQTLEEKKDRTENNIGEMIREVIGELDDQVKATKADIHIFTEEKVILFSKENIKRIIFNLLTNALKFKHPGRNLKIDITCVELEEYIVLLVRDNGIGISETSKAKIFTMFNRGHGISGRGVGLYIVKRIMENHGGKVEFESREGMGSTFKLFFPKNL